MNKLDQLSINTLKVNSVAAINKANSGHPGIALGAAIISHTLFTRHLNFDIENPNWINRDRFVLSAGHGSSLLYSHLRILGYINEQDLKDFRQLNSLTPGHPEYKHTIGVEATTGPLGQGLAMAVGLALAQAHLKSKFKELDHYTYVLCGDGDLQEGVANEALDLAGHLGLEKLIVLYDSNDVQLDSKVDLVYSSDNKKRFEAMNFNYILVDKTSVENIDKAIKKAKASSKPTIIEIKTIIGEGAHNQGTSDVHGAPLGKNIDVLLKNLNWNNDSFYLPEEVKKYYQETLGKRSSEAFKKFKASSELEKFLSQKPNVDFSELKLENNLATRIYNGKILDFLSSKNSNIIGGSADLTVSTKAAGSDGIFSKTNLSGRNIFFGVREFAMAAISNGMALHSNLIPFSSTFLVFADYLKAAIRLGALMNLKTLYIFSHDSVFVGEDGPTHQPIEQLAMLRSIPNVAVFRPADQREMQGAYAFALNNNGPTVIATTRQNIVSLENSSSQKSQNGYYQLLDSNSEYSLIASGSEVANALEIAKELKLNMYSVPAMNLVEDFPWKRDKTISIEAASTFGWSKLAKYNIGIDRFGLSAPGNLVYKEMKLDIDSLRQKIKSIIEK
ncbi:transketolase [Mycoplasmopsis pulmonis]|uniref:transketolase n=1 Tax=Mycoplasmopsis pulmonis TaxID=2107 RepID=UPI001005008C|nr:transketolase [Mycoplasmopsis pulmonis]VEU68279.1 Transketolase [Mycoplasmopsis pulmonis]